MPVSSIAKSAILMVFLVLISVLSWESYLRHNGVAIAYDDNPALWSDKRAMVYEPIDKATVFIGSSRITYDLDIDTWKNITGDHPVLLAIPGDCPRPVLEDLGNDKNFKGRLVVDVTEGLFFSSDPENSGGSVKRVKYYKDQTPAQRVGFFLDHLLESRFVFLDDNFTLGATLDKLGIHNRKGVFSPPNLFPMEFGRATFDRQNIMTHAFLTDSNIRKKVTNLWMFYEKINTELPVSGDSLLHVLQSIKASTDKIKARGGQVLFVRTPSSGHYLESEKKDFPRSLYWDRLLAFTGCPGIHFADYTAIDHFDCPEWSHLSQDQAIVFTKEFIRILKDEKGWKFLKPIASIN